MTLMEFFESHESIKNDSRGVLLKKKKPAPVTATMTQKPRTPSASASSTPSTQPTKVASTAPPASSLSKTKMKPKSSQPSSSSLPPSSSSTPPGEPVRRKPRPERPELPSSSAYARVKMPGADFKAVKDRLSGKTDAREAAMTRKGEKEVKGGKAKGANGGKDEGEGQGEILIARRPFPLAKKIPELYTWAPSNDDWKHGSDDSDDEKTKEEEKEKTPTTKLKSTAKKKKKPRVSSPDPMLLSAESRDISLEPETESELDMDTQWGKRRASGVRRKTEKKEEVLVPSSSGARRAAKAAAEGKTQKEGKGVVAARKRTREETSDLSTAEESDSSLTSEGCTPKAKVKKGGSKKSIVKTETKKESVVVSKSSGVKKKKSQSRVESPERELVPEEEAQGAAFFRRYKNMSQKDRDLVKDPEGGKDLMEQLLVASQEALTPPTSPPDQSGDDAEDGLTADERLYLRDYTDPDTLCEFCREPMPALQTRYLQDEATRLARIKLREFGDADLPWDRTIAFCESHRAEARIIPLGKRAGYPDDIDFTAIPDRLESAAIRHDLGLVMRYPDRSSLFSRIVKRIAKRGKGAWLKSIRQGDAKARDLTMVGYYGYIGRQIISYHYETLLIRGALFDLSPAADGTSPVAPLTAREFVDHVLVPESAIRLIMDDQGWSGSLGEDWAGARAKAYATWKESTEYGKWRFRGEGPDEVAAFEEIKSAMKVKIGDWQVAREGDRERRLVEAEEGEVQSDMVKLKEEKGGARVRAKSEASEVIELDASQEAPGEIGQMGEVIDVSCDVTPKAKVKSRGKRGEEGSPIVVESTPVSRVTRKSERSVSGRSATEAAAGEVEVKEVVPHPLEKPMEDEVQLEPSNTQSSFGDVDDSWMGQVMDEYEGK